jgi:hypothetical protein
LHIDAKTKTIIHGLLAKHGISVYEIEAIPEGTIVEGDYPGELKAMSGYIITSVSIYAFWFKWQDGKYTLGEEDGSWQEMKDESGRDAEITRTIQRRLKNMSSTLNQ